MPGAWGRQSLVQRIERRASVAEAWRTFSSQEGPQRDVHFHIHLQFQEIPFVSDRSPHVWAGPGSKGWGGPLVITVKQPSIQALSQALYEPRLPAPPTASMINTVP